MSYRSGGGLNLAVSPSPSTFEAESDLICGRILVSQNLFDCKRKEGREGREGCLRQGLRSVQVLDYSKLRRHVLLGPNIGIPVQSQH